MPTPSSLLVSSLFILCAASFGPSARALERPPQFVAISFDGSRNVSRWEETRDLARRSTRLAGQPVHFSYFLSGVYFLSDAHKKLYQAPGGKPCFDEVTGKDGVKRTVKVHCTPEQAAANRYSRGASALGNGGEYSDILNRVDQVNFAIEEGHEIGSHANGHYDGWEWNQTDWTSEFDQFTSFVFDSLRLNGLFTTLRGANGIRMNPNEVHGFRAPLLETSDGLWATLKDKGFTYDCSWREDPKKWPKRRRINGVTEYWSYPLAELRIAGSGKKVLSMDYNFYAQQSGGVDDKDTSRYPLYEQEMQETYFRYFLDNYLGNRAPVHIGHHFGLWNGSAYWKALQTFTEVVCALPEVRCVNYGELTEWMNALPEETKKEYQAAHFPLMKRRTALPVKPYLKLGAPIELDADFSWKTDRKSFVPSFAGADSDRILRDPRVTLLWTLDGVPVREGSGKLRGAGGGSAYTAHLSKSSLPRLSDGAQHELSFRVLRVEGSGTREIQSATRTVRFRLGQMETGVRLEERALEVDPPSAHEGD